MNREATRVLFAWAPAAVYMALIWGISSMSAPSFPIELFPLRDKGVHATEYGVLAFFLAHACRRTWPAHAWSRVGLAAVYLTVLWGFLDEVHQAFVPGRSADVLDLAADSIGACAGAAARRMASGIPWVGDGPKVVRER
jgi:VanZ family protein